MSTDWSDHLRQVDGPLIHLVELASDAIEVQKVEDEARKLGFHSFRLVATGTRSLSSLMNVLSRSFEFPAWFGRNWDAASDLLRDLSWKPANGYVCSIIGAEDLLGLEVAEFEDFVRLFEDTVADWREETGELGNRRPPVPFHVLFHGEIPLGDALRATMREPLCEHVTDGAPRTWKRLGGVTRSEFYHEVFELFQSQSSTEEKLRRIREIGVSKTFAKYLIAAASEASVLASRHLLDTSPAWEDLRDAGQLHRAAASTILPDGPNGKK